MSINSCENSNFEYRTDIDGLRAIAVLSVIGYHFFPLWIHGGFVGVDIFFVISGYLITNKIYSDLDKGKFSLSNFFASRVRRIFPSLIIVLISFGILGWVILLPDEYAQLGKHIAGAISLVSNNILWFESGYFDNLSNTKPLLHLWSLGVEGQFYLIWPILNLIAFRLNINLGFLTIFIAVLSFVLSQNKSNISAVADFYFIATRFWELIAGSILAWIYYYRPFIYTNLVRKINGRLKIVCINKYLSRSGIFVKNMCSVCGLALIAYGILEIDKTIEYPRVWAVIPVAAALLIIAGRHTFINKYILSNKWIVLLGLVSYPLYLWHWPLFSFWVIVNDNPPNFLNSILLILISIILALLTYFYVEKPILSKRFNFTHKISFASFFVLFFGMVIYINNGAFNREIELVNTENQKQLLTNFAADDDCLEFIKRNQEFCRLSGDVKNIQIAIIGDSTANALSQGLITELQKSNNSVGVINLGAGTCLPFNGTLITEMWGGENTPIGKNCVSVISQSLENLKNINELRVLIIGIFPHDFENWGLEAKFKPGEPSARKKEIETKLRKMTQPFLERGVHVFASYDLTYLNKNARDCIFVLYRNKKNCGNNIIINEPYNSYFDDIFYNIPEIKVLKYQDVFFDKNNNFQLFDEDGIIKIRDNAHLSLRGSELFAKQKILPEILKYLENLSSYR